MTGNEIFSSGLHTSLFLAFSGAQICANTLLFPNVNSKKALWLLSTNGNRTNLKKKTTTKN